MATHFTIDSMLQESLVEMVLVAQYCVNYRKDPLIWQSHGCFGYPAALLLLSIADSIGSYVIGGKVENHFKILNHKDYYNLGLDDKDIKIIYNNYRNLLSHNTVLASESFLDMGNEKSCVFEIRNGRSFINLVPFFIKTNIVVAKFLKNADKIVRSSKALSDILKKG